MTITTVTSEGRPIIDPITVAGFALGITEVLKRAGMRSALAPVCAGLVGLIYGVGEALKANGLATAHAAAYVASGETGLVLGLGAVGIHCTASAVSAYRATQPAPESPIIIPPTISTP